MGIDRRLIQSVMNHSVAEEFLIGKYKKDGYMITKPQVDFKINADINWDKKCASLSIEFKLFFI